MSGRRHFWEKKKKKKTKKKNWNWNWNAQKNKKQKKSSQKRERGGGGVGLREEEEDEDGDEQQQQQPWRGTKKKRTCVSMILSVLMCFSLSVSFFFLSSLPNCVDSYIYFCDCAFI